MQTLNEVPTPDVEEAPERPRDAAESAWWLLLTPLLPGMVAVPYCRWLLPLLAPLPVFAAFARQVRARRYGRAWLLVMAWAVLLVAGVIGLVEFRPKLAGDGILHGPEYKAEMRDWIVNGVGRESTPSQFVPEHLKHLGAFLGLTVASGGYMGLAMGAYLLGYMSFYVGSFALKAGPLGGLAAWVPWSIVRIASFVLFLAVLARPLLVWRQEPGAWRLGKREVHLLGLALVGIVADMLLKAAFAPGWSAILRGFLTTR